MRTMVLGFLTCATPVLLWLHWVNIPVRRDLSEWLALSFGVLVILAGLLMLTYLRHVRTNVTLSREERRKWTVAILFFWPMSAPIYFFRYVLSPRAK